MPHQCTGCGHTFEDGSKEMLSGCPECGGNKFQFRPAGEPADRSPDGADASPERDSDTVSGDPDATDADRTSGPDRPEPDTSSVAETVGRATTRVRDFVSSNSTQSDPESDSEWPDEWESSTDIPSDGTSEDDVADEGDDDIIDADARRAASEESGQPKEDTAQASARTDVVSPEELDDGVSVSPGEPDDGTPADDAPPVSSTGDSLSTSDTDESSPDAEDSSSISDTEDPSSTSDRSTPTHPSPAAPDSTPDGEVVSEPTGEDPDLSELRAQLNDQFESIKILEPGQYELNLMELYDREEYIIALQENGRYVIQVPEQWIGDDADDR